MKQLSFNFYDLENLRNDTYTFNRIAGNDKKLTYADLKFYTELLQEELDETKGGVDLENDEEILDGAVDVLVVALGLVQKLEQLGFDVSGAMEAVAQNNLSKYPRNKEDAVKSLKPGWSCEEYQGAQLWVIKDENGKIRKPWNFKSVDLKQFTQSKGIK
jgi:hypothetical protein